MNEIDYVDDRIDYPDDTSAIRRENIKTHLKRGDLKVLAEKLGKKPNYLSQLFSFNSKRALSKKLARAIEEALNLEPGTLDREPSRVSFEEQMRDEEESARKELLHAKKSNTVSELAFELLQLKLKNMLSDAIFTIDAQVEFNDQTYVVRLLIQDVDMKARVCVETTRSMGGLNFMAAETSLLRNIAITGAEYGLLATETEGQLVERWYQSSDGKVTLIQDKPNL